MKVFCNGFWSNFYDINPINYKLFIYILSKVFDQDITIGSYYESEILLESGYGNSIMNNKDWKYKIFFSGETWEIKDIDRYNIVLGPFNTEKNLVSFPLFLANVYCSNFFDKLENPVNIDKIPKKDVCCIVSNPNGQERNCFLDHLEKEMKIDYFGNFRNNTFKLKSNYNTKEFFNIVSNYKFVITMENSKQDCYVTEKILHGFMSNNIPVYWGADQVTDYFDESRFIYVKQMNKKQIYNAINEIKRLNQNPSEYLKKVNQPILKDNKWNRSIDDIVTDMKNLVNHI